MANPNPTPIRSQAAAPPRVSRMKLADAKSGKLDVPCRVLLYGPEGIGKSTFGANAPKPIFLGAESGTSQLDVTRFPEARTWDDVLDAVAELTNEQHSFETLVVDTLDWAEPLCWGRICERGDKGKRMDSIESFGYGRGFQMALDEWRVLLRSLERLIAAKRMNVILLAHAHIKTFKNPEGDDFDRYQLKMHEKAGGLLKEWCDDVLFAKYETFSLGEDTRKAISNGARVIHTTRQAAFDAKNRNGLPETLPLSWDDYFAAVKSHAPASPADLEAEIRSLLPRLNGDAQHAIDAITRANGDATKLSLLLNWCRSKARNEHTSTVDTSKEETKS